MRTIKLLRKAQKLSVVVRRILVFIVHIRVHQQPGPLAEPKHYLAQPCNAKMQIDLFRSFIRYNGKLKYLNMEGDYAVFSAKIKEGGEVGSASFVVGSEREQSHAVSNHFRS